MWRLKWILQIICLYILSIVGIQSEIPSSVIPVKTNFSCIDRTAGFYADVDTRCKIYHTCDEFGNKFTYQCPEETAFRQDALICDHAHLVKCQGSVPPNTEMQKEKYNNSSCAKGSTDNTNCHFFFKSLQEIQPIKIYNAEQRGFAFSSQDIPNNFNTTKVGENKIIKFFHPPLNNYNLTTNVPLDRFTNIKTQHIPFVNHNQQNRSTIEENSSVPSQIINDKVKFNGREEVNQKANDALYNFLKYSLNTFPEKVQNQQNNMNNHHIIKNSPDFLKLSFMNHRNYPYTETLNSIQKITKMPSTTINTSLTTTEVPLYALTLSLKPLVPNEQEHDPYYPKFSTSTESYYTPSHSDNKQPQIKVYTQTWSNTHIKLPPVLPDLNSLEDIVDRRKQFYIPRIKFD